MQPTHTQVTDPAVTTGTTLRRAGLYLLAHGWHQGDMFADPDQPTPAACALGAIRMAVYGTPTVTVEQLDEQACGEFDHAVGVLSDYLVEFYGLDPVPAEEYPEVGTPQADVVIEWNDSSCTIASHVIAALNGAADYCESVHPHQVGGGA